MNFTLYGVFFIDPSRGFAVGDQGVVLRTVDSGAHWILTQPSGLPDIPVGTTPLVVTFAGRYAGVDVPLLSIDASGIVGAGHAAVVAETTPGAYSANPGGLTSIYAVRFGMDGFHGVAVPGQLIQTWLPDFSTAGAVKTGEVEMGPVAVVLKSSRAAAVLPTEGLRYE